MGWHNDIERRSRIIPCCQLQWLCINLVPLSLKWNSNMQFFQNIISTCGVSSHDQAKQALFQRNLMISRNISREPEEIRLIRIKWKKQRAYSCIISAKCNNCGVFDEWLFLTPRNNTCYFIIACISTEFQRISHHLINLVPMITGR